MSSDSVHRRAAGIKLLLMDCDGVLTDGRIWLPESNDDQKAFHTRDGLGIEIWHRAGMESGIISGRTSSAVARRAAGLGMSYVRQGCENKRKAFDAILAQAGLSQDQVAFIGDDLNDIPLMRQSGLAVAVADAVPEARSAAHYMTTEPGGRGAVREVVELILKAQGRWKELTERYLA